MKALVNILLFIPALLLLPVVLLGGFIICILEGLGYDLTAH
jgi:hypothetical protein